MERLTMKWKNGVYDTFNPIDIEDNEYSKINYEKLLKKLGEYEDLEEQGLLLRLPCRVGATVYWLRLQESFSPIIIPCRVARYATKEDRPNKRYMEEVKLIYNGFSKRHSVTEFGKTLFLTKEEAEAVLEQMKGEEHETD